LPVEIELQGLLFAFGLKQVVNCSHKRTLLGFSDPVAVEFTRASYLERYFDSPI
jgi:hypothetical protein